MKTNFILHYYGGMDLQVRLEEDWNKIDLFIVYEDHGDEFLQIRTKDGNVYKYGYVGNRKGILDEGSCYTTQPELFCIEDKHSTLANKIFHQFNSDRSWYTTTYQRVFSDLGGVEKHYDKETATRRLVEACNYLQDAYSLKIFYNVDDYKRRCIQYIKENELDEKYIEQMDKVKWSSKRNGIDGYVGKLKYFDNDRIICENVRLIIHKNKVKHNCTKREINFDEWGIATYEINLKQFN